MLFFGQIKKKKKRGCLKNGENCRDVTLITVDSKVLSDNYVNFMTVVLYFLFLRWIYS